MKFENRSRFKEVIDEIAESQTLDDLQKLVGHMRRTYRLANIAYHAVHIPAVATPNPILILTYEPEWVRRYKEHDYFKIDPVVVSGVKEFLPLDWSSLDHETKIANSFFHQADRFDVGRQGVTLPIRGKNGERALFTVTSNMSHREWETNRIDYMREFQLIAHYFHDRAVQLSGHNVSVDAPKLSTREMECLELSAHGLVPKQIAGKFGISDRTVRLYLASACNKLGCASVYQAVTKLVTLEAIQPIL